MAEGVALSKQIVNPVNQLGRRLRESSEPTQDDLRELSHVLEERAKTLEIVARQLREIGLSPTTRIKNTGTIIEKLKRESTLKLSKIQDLAGARIVRSMTLDEQDEIVSMIIGKWPSAKVKDRRVSPTYGYRAVHVIVEIDGYFVEIQVRTHYQHAWAQATESFGDLWGRAIRYGGDPEEPDRPVSDGVSITRRELIGKWKEMSNDFYKLAELENDVSRIRALLPKIEDTRERVTQEEAIRSLEIKIAKKFKNEKDIFEILSRSLR